MSLGLSFGDPLLGAAAVALVLAALAWRGRRPPPALRFPGMGDLGYRGAGPRVALHRARPWVQGLALLALAVALARPRAGKTIEMVHSQGVDIMLALDVSGSMSQGHDLPPNRLEVAKQVVSGFIDGRKNDRIGLVVFAGAAFTRCPLTLDYGILRRLLETLREGTVAVDGTAIGTALATGVSRLRDSEAESQVIVLLTDGANNAGEIAPEDAAKIAKDRGIKVYTIGVGGDGTPRGGHFLQRLVQTTALDEPLLKKLASETGGRYFRATDEEDLQKIFQIIDRLERSELEARSFTRYRELAWPLLALACLALALDFAVGVGVLGVLP